MTDKTIAQRVRQVVIDILDADPEKVTDRAAFIDDLGADSLDFVDLVLAFEAEFDIDISDDEAEKAATIGDAVDAITKRIEAAE